MYKRMKHLLMNSRLEELYEVQIDLEEVIEIIEISRSLFQKNLTSLRQKIEQEPNTLKKKELYVEALKRYKEYQATLAILDEFIFECEQIYKKNT